jgi:CRISPR type I-E-associated protein CasB/Cse2
VSEAIATEPTTDHVDVFVSRLAKLDRGDLAILRRNAGRTLAETRNAAGLFYRLLPLGVPERDEELYFLLATLYGLNDHKPEKDFGATMRAVRVKTGRESVDRRMAILLDSEFDLVDGFRPGGGEMAYRLRQCVRLAASEEVGVDWAVLLRHLLRWMSASKHVRKQWARSYYGRLPEETSDSQNTKGGNS